MSVSVVFVHGIRTSATMWRSQLEYLAARGTDAVALDLPGHGARMAETFTLEGALETIDTAVREAATRGKVLLAAHSMGGLISTSYVGGDDPPPVDGFVAASCTAFPRGLALAAYRLLARRFDALPDRGQWLADRVLDRTLPPETRADFGAGGYAYDAQDVALASLSTLDLLASLHRIQVPVWFINGEFDQLRINEKVFAAAVPQSELYVVPRTSHLVTAMRPAVFDKLLELALLTLEREPDPR